MRGNSIASWVKVGSRNGLERRNIEGEKPLADDSDWHGGDALEVERGGGGCGCAEPFLLLLLRLLRLLERARTPHTAAAAARPTLPLPLLLPSLPFLLPEAACLCCSPPHPILSVLVVPVVWGLMMLRALSRCSSSIVVVYVLSLTLLPPPPPQVLPLCGGG